MSSEKWNERYAEPEPVYGPEPNLFLTSQAHLIPSGGTVLSLGEGEGRNACWLAQQSFHVTAIDYSHVAIAKTAALASERGVIVNTVLADLTNYAFAADTYDAIVSIFVHFAVSERRAFHRRIMTSLKVGGHFIGEFFSPDQLAFRSGGPKSPEFLYDPHDLEQDFDAHQIVFLQKREVTLHEGRYHQGPASVTRIVVCRMS